MSPIVTIGIIIVGWLALIGFVHLVVLPRLSRGPANEPLTGLIWRLLRVYCRVVHRLRITGQDLVPRSEDHGGLIVVSNHTGAIDPLLIQCGCPFVIRWLMATEFMSPALNWVWERYGVIPVGRDGRDSGPLRQAIRHVRSGGAVGVFPEGRLVQERGEIWDWHPGLDVLAEKTKAPVLLVWVHGTPEELDTTKNLRTPSRSVVEFIDRVEWEDGRTGSLTERLRDRIAEVSGWRVVGEGT